MGVKHRWWSIVKMKVELHNCWSSLSRYKLMKKVIFFPRLKLSANLAKLSVVDVLFDFFALDYYYRCWTRRHWWYSVWACYPIGHHMTNVTRCDCLKTSDVLPKWEKLPRDRVLAVLFFLLFALNLCDLFVDGLCCLTGLACLKLLLSISYLGAVCWAVCYL